MNLFDRYRSASLSLLIVPAAIAGALAVGAPAAASQMPVIDEECVYYELHHEEARPVVVFENDPSCPVNIAVHDAVTEAAAWPDFDPSDMTAEIAETNSRLEAATWPNFDSTALGDRLDMAQAAADEAATWPDFDSTSIDTGAITDIAANSPRMAQIAAIEADAEVAARGNPYVL
jgi:hypothetical protein